MSKQPQKSFTTNEVVGLHWGIQTLLSISLDDFGVNDSWEQVINKGVIKLPFENIQEQTQKMGKEYLDEVEGQDFGKIKKGKEEAYENAKKELEQKVFTLELHPIRWAKIEELSKKEDVKKLITGRLIDQLKPIIIK